MSISKIDNPMSDVKSVYYIEKDGKVISVEPFADEAFNCYGLPDEPIGKCEEWDGCKEQQAFPSSWLPSLNYRFGDEIAVKSWQQHAPNLIQIEKGFDNNEQCRAEYCEQANEYRTVPKVSIVEIDGADGPTKLKTDIHRFIATQYSLPKNKKVKVSFEIKDQITGELVDWDEELRFKVQVLDDGIPEELTRGDIECKDGKGYFEFDAPTTKKKAFLKIKPPKEGYGEDGEFLGLHPDKFVCLLSFK